MKRQLSAALRGFAQECPALVVAPVAEDLEVFGGEAFHAEAAAAGQGDGGGIVGLDVGFQAVKAQLGEGKAGDQGEALGHAALAGELCGGVVAKVGALEAASDDAAEADDAGDAGGGQVADEEAVVGDLVAGFEIGLVGLGGFGGLDPRVVEVPACGDHGEEVGFVGGGWAADADVGGSEIEGWRHVRDCIG
jgi:hypothetical protein